MNKRKLISELKTHHMYISAMDTKKSESVAAGIAIAINLIKKHEESEWIDTLDELPPTGKLVLLAADLGEDSLVPVVGQLIEYDVNFVDEYVDFTETLEWLNSEGDSFVAEFNDVKYWLPIPEFPKH
ncbi:hypothetical protein C0208_01345 [Moraxella catarrhalis]|uniref:hypothetical protein n=1 Tax=Moraxella catarrhalis TaxID=480 RepID=UPI00128C8C03|nr:hypothetical protein [Moraxella catarrhalis]MPW63472.1 hypothetical protein [Moraxella catarrhalis]